MKCCSDMFEVFMVCRLVLLNVEGYKLMER